MTNIFTSSGAKLTLFGGERTASGKLPLITLPSFDESSDIFYKTVSDICSGNAFYLLEIKVDDWNEQLSPWPVSEPQAFSGGGSVFLRHITDDILSEIIKKESTLDTDRMIIIGYSLAGLFSLWSMYNTSVFAAAASCSGSLWYSGFIDYMSSHDIKDKSKIYLSLGSKEEKSRNALFSTIGDKTREAADILKNDPRAAKTELVFNPGGHGTDVEKRIALAMKWCLENT